MLFDRTYDGMHFLPTSLWQSTAKESTETKMMKHKIWTLYIWLYTRNKINNFPTKFEPNDLHWDYTTMGHSNQMDRWSISLQEANMATRRCITNFALPKHMQARLWQMIAQHVSSWWYALISNNWLHSGSKQVCAISESSSQVLQSWGFCSPCILCASL